MIRPTRVVIENPRRPAVLCAWCGAPKLWGGYRLRWLGVLVSAVCSVLNVPISNGICPDCEKEL